jgi:opacity protein-like surface antigen
MLVLIALLMPGRAISEELQLGVAGDYTFDSNYFFSSEGTESANSFQLGPLIRLTDPDGRFRYDIDFTGSYQAYVEKDELNAWESRLRANATYDFTERTRVRITNRFRDISNLRFSRRDIQVADTALDPNQDRYFRNNLRLELIHELTDLLDFRLRGGYAWIDFEKNRDRNDSEAYEGAAELRYQVSTGHFVGLGGSFTRQDYEQSRSRLGSKADYVSGFATWTWVVSDQVTLRANGGPAWVRSDEDSPSQVEQTQYVGGLQNDRFSRARRVNCTNGEGRASDCTLAPVANPASDLGPILTFPLSLGEQVGTDSSLTFFGGASIDASFEKWNLNAIYERTQSTASGDSLASSLDRLALELEYAPPKYRWSLFVAGSWDRRTTLTDSTFIDFDLQSPPFSDSEPAERVQAVTEIRSRNTKRDNFTAIAGYRYRLEENFSASLEGRYRRTEFDGPGPNRPGVDTYFVVLRFEYQLDPIAF